METAVRTELAAVIRAVYELEQQLQTVAHRLDGVYHTLTGLLDDDELAAVERELVDR